MSYAADGPLDPKFPEEVSETFLQDVMGYRALVIGWSDDTYTLHIYKIITVLDIDTIQDGDVIYDYFPDEEKVRLIIEETLEERFDRSIG